ncbi:P-type HAD superfamily ATPase [Nitzschia inconspicua]|uniref:P-type HAD superfamily ATPase n=1 Tax=Nitzschia inconspicua TaxID=303405 RepID=A0A9K3KJ11_9STRA|nr:P-type HAD superfamily ATPase [Nitzschia inconspicua]
MNTSSDTAVHTLDTEDVTPQLNNAAVGAAFIESYSSLRDISTLHQQSNINLQDLEKCGGLSSEEVLKRLMIHGKNILTPPPQKPEWKRFLEQFTNLFLLLLVASGVLSLIASLVLGDITSLYLAVVLFVVVFLTALLQFHEEGQANKVMESFSKLLATSCVAFRDGHQKTVNVEELVPGDVVLIKNGDKVPADMVLLLCRGLKVECSSLTGESEPISCTDKPSSNGTRLFECRNVVFSGSLCFDGMAVALVLSTGDHTAIGTIAKLASETKRRTSVLQNEVRNFVKLVAFIALTLATSSFVISIFVQDAKTVDQIFALFVNGFLTILVANVPQGLPSTVISLLSLAARRMALQSVMVKRIDCVETLGSCSIICSDKTGTLTKNEMTVTDIWYNQRVVRRHRREAESLFSQEPQALLYRCGVLCNKAVPCDEHQLSNREDSIRDIQLSRISNLSRLSWRSTVRNSILSHDEVSMLPKFSGNPSDVAILSHCNTIISVQRMRKEFPILFEVPFNSSNKWSLVITRTKATLEDGQAEFEVMMKGAPEVILDRCSTYASTKGASHKTEITEAFHLEFMEAYEKFASQGRRVLALCSKTFHAPVGTEFQTEDSAYNFPTTDLNFIGLVAIMDPPRDNVPDAVSKCLSAGVKVFMVTGDHPFTARAIAKDIGLLKNDHNILLLEGEATPETDWEACSGAVIHGSRIDDLTEAQWRTILAKEGGVCFCRTTPAHKLMIVEKCQTLMGQIVAVTGDGVNDAPALKQADIGVAMGLNGSAVAQDAADILLMDDNFASIVAGIEEGRIIFDNIKKTIAYTMAHIFPQILSALIALLLRLPAGLTPMQVLTIDLGTELGPAISLAYEKAESDIMKRKPRNPVHDRLVSPNLLFYSYITSGFMISIGCMAAYTITYAQNGLWLSDFFAMSGTGGSSFSLGASDPVTVKRTGRTYSPSEQQEIFSQGTAAFYIALTVAQFFHIWACKTRISSLFVHGFGNKLTFYGVLVGLILVVFFSYVPGVQNFVGSAQVGWVPWVCGPVAGCFLFLYNELVKVYIRSQIGKKPSCMFKMVSW